MAQLESFVVDESSAIQWLKRHLGQKPQGFQDVHPQFLRETAGWRKHEKLPDLSEILEQDFLRYDGVGEVPSQIHGYLSTNFKELRNLAKDPPALRDKAKDRWYVPDPNRAADVEQRRTRALLREFEEYRKSQQRRLRLFRLEAVRAGFLKAYQEQDYATITQVAEKNPGNRPPRRPEAPALVRSGSDAHGSRRMTITRVKLERFTAFESLDFKPSPGINVLVGANGTGKTHLMKVVYAACDVSKTGADFAEKLVRVFMPSGDGLGRLVKRRRGNLGCDIKVFRGRRKLLVSFSNHTKAADTATVGGSPSWKKGPIESVYVPVKEMLANAPGFRSLYAHREIHFEEVYQDILHRAYRPVLRGQIPPQRKRLLAVLRRSIEGKVLEKNEEFFLRNKQGDLEFSLLAEGMRKLGLLWLLIQNGTLLEGSVLFWDEPETNLNPKLFGSVIEILLELQRIGVQIFIATHDYVILKELDLQKKEGDKLAFHSLYRDDGEITCHTSGIYLDIHPNAIAEAFTDLYDREVERSFLGCGK